jgi:hypothetical protein
MISFYSNDTDIDKTPGTVRLNRLAIPATSLLYSPFSSPRIQLVKDLLPPEPLAQRHRQKCLFEAFANSHFGVVRYLIREAGVETKPIEASLAWHASTNGMPVENFEFLVQEGWDINSPICRFKPALRYIPLTSVIFPPFTLTTCLLFPTFLTLALF